MHLQQDIFDRVQKEEEDKAKEAHAQLEGEEAKKDVVMPTREQIDKLVEPLLKEELEFAFNKRQSDIDFKPGAVPKSLIDLKVDDTEGNVLYAITTIREDTSDYIKVLRKSGFQCE